MRITLSASTRFFLDRRLRRISVLAVLGGMVAGGCATYNAKPLTTESVARNLQVPNDDELTKQAGALKFPALPPVAVDLSDGINPQEAAVLAVIVNPTLRAERDRLGLAEAQVIQAGILPNPQLSFSRDFVTGGNTVDTQPAYAAGIDGEITALLTRHDSVAAAKANDQAVRLDVAWTEWQAAQSARIAVYRVISLQDQIGQARSAADLLGKEVETLRQAVNLHERSLLDLAAAETSKKDADLTVLNLQQELEQQRIELSRALGFPPDRPIRIQPTPLPSALAVPDVASLDQDLQDRRLDLLGLKAGYASQDATLRAAILNQFPKISLGFNRAADTSNVQTAGFAISVDIPIFDRNQGAIATERATRKQLFDEYSDRVFQAQCDVASAVSAIKQLNTQIAVARQAVTQLERLVTIAGSELKSGNIDVISYYQRRNDLIQRRIDLSKLSEQLIENFIALEIASGRYLPVPTNS